MRVVKHLSRLRQITAAHNAVSSSYNGSPFSRVRLWREWIMTHLCDTHSGIFYTSSSSIHKHTGRRSRRKLCFCSGSGVQPEINVSQSHTKGEKTAHGSSRVSKPPHAQVNGLWQEAGVPENQCGHTENRLKPSSGSVSRSLAP